VRLKKADRIVIRGHDPRREVVSRFCGHHLHATRLRVAKQRQSDSAAASGAIDSDEAQMLAAGDRHPVEVAMNSGHRLPFKATAETLLLGDSSDVVWSIVGSGQKFIDAREVGARRQPDHWSDDSWRPIRKGGG